MSLVFRIISRNRRKTVLLTAALLLRLLVAPVIAEAFDVIIVKDAEIKPYRDAITGFKSACGCGVREMDLSDMGALEEAIKARPDAVLAVGSTALRKMKAVKSVPVVYVLVIPSEADAYASNNVFGVDMDISPETSLNTMIQLFPGVKRIGLLSDPEHTGPYVEEAAAVARAKGISLLVKKISNSRRAPALLEELRGTVDVLWMLPDATVVNSETINYLLLFSFQNKAPIFSFSEKYVKQGAVAALLIDPFDMGAQAGETARDLFQGGKPPQRAYARGSRLMVNRRVAAKIGVRINDELVRNAEKVE